jgi:hypothetical protein
MGQEAERGFSVPHVVLGSLGLAVVWIALGLILGTGTAHAADDPGADPLAQIAPALDLPSDGAVEVVAPVVEPIIEPVVEPIVERVAPIPPIATAADSVVVLVEAAAEPLAPVVDAVIELTAPVVAPAVDALAPATEALIEPGGALVVPAETTIETSSPVMPAAPLRWSAEPSQHTMTLAGSFESSRGETPERIPSNRQAAPALPTSGASATGSAGAAPLALVTDVCSEASAVRLSDLSAGSDELPPTPSFDPGSTPD